MNMLNIIINTSINHICSAGGIAVNAIQDLYNKLNINYFHSFLF